MVQEEITLEALEAQPKDTYLLVDIRDEAAFQFGHMDGAIHIPANELPERHAELPKDRFIAEVVLLAKTQRQNCGKTDFLR